MFATNGAKGIATNGARTLLVAPGIAPRKKKLLSGGHRYWVGSQRMCVELTRQVANCQVSSKFAEPTCSQDDCASFILQRSWRYSCGQMCKATNRILIQYWLKRNKKEMSISRE